MKKEVLLLNYEFDDYNGVIIDKQDLPNNIEQFTLKLDALLLLVKHQGKQLVWFSLSIDQSKLIEVLTTAGFVFHNCLEDEITLILRVKKDAYAPFVPTHSIGAGALIFNEDQQILVIREHLANHTGFKLPGGHIELGEKISEAIVREVFEETGIQSEFVGIQGFASKKVFRFGKSNLYFLCRLNALTQEINIQDTDEIAEAKWCDVSTFIHDENNSLFVRKVVMTLQNELALRLTKSMDNEEVNWKHEVFLAKTPFTET